MRHPKLYLAALALAVLSTGCGFGVLDNYDEPRSTISGRVVYQGKPIGVRSNGVQLELWQPGFALRQKIPVFIGQDGSFSAVVFDGDYMLNLIPGNGPWVDTRDTIQVQLSGQATVEVPVVPYYTIDNPTVRYANGAIEATFNVGQVNTTRAVEYVGLYVGTTSFVDRTSMSVRVERPRSAIPSLSGPITLSQSLSGGLAQRQDVYVRIGVKTVGVAELLFSPVLKVTL